MASQRILPADDRSFHAGSGAAYLERDVASLDERILSPRSTAWPTELSALLGGFLLGGVLILLALPEPPALLAHLQASQAYKLATGAVLLSFMLFQWLLAVARSRRWLQASKHLYALHKSVGLCGPVLLYAHASRWGFGFLGVLMGALFANHVLGLMRSSGVGLPRWAIAGWTVAHVALSVLVVVLAGYHGWQVFYRE